MTEDTDETNDSPLATAIPPTGMLTTANRPCKEDRAEERLGSEDMAEWHETTANEERPATAEEKFGENTGPVSVNYAAVKVFV